MQLTSYKGYTVDFRLREFRRVAGNKIVFIPFVCNAGGKLLGDMIAEGLVANATLVALF